MSREPALPPEQVAAIVAAVAACMGARPEDVRLGSVRPVGAASGPAPGAWALAARLHLLEGRRAMHARRFGR